MTEPIKHHYVPQTYLKNFCVSGEKNLFVFDKEKNKWQNRNIKNIAYEKHFYKVNNNIDWEYFFSKEYELKYPHIIEKLTSICTLSTNETVILDEQLKEEISKMILVQFLRSKKTINYYSKVIKNSVDLTFESFKDKEFQSLDQSYQKVFNDIELKFDKNFIKDIILQFNNKEKIEKFIPYLKNKVWIIYYNKISGNIPFITSDNPVILYNTKIQDTNFEDNGLDSNHTQIIFPITSKILISLYFNKLFNGVIKDFNDRLVIVDDIRFITDINKIQYKQCINQIYSPFIIAFNPLSIPQE